FWFRAMAGAVTSDPQEVYKLESEIFGNTERKSRVVVRVKTQFLSDNFGKFKLLPHKNFTALAIKPEEEFEIELIAKDNSFFELAISSFWMSVTLGGWGRRSRRGAGTTKILNVEGDFEEQIKKFLSRPLKKQLDFVKEQFSSSLRAYPANQKAVWPYLRKVYQWEKTLSRPWDKNSPIYEIFNKHSSYLKVNGDCLGDRKPRYASPIIMRIVEKNNKYTILFSILKTQDRCDKIIENFLKLVGKTMEVWHA
ncbi:MAG: type III-B CRISPR module RAMP protein Cmr1, partial [Desulfonauticus sp.]|nr:type III-B CRISPR module RAMP protein Cmr1 [Desulfonauticus sp.]